jgi:hypothetical protein
MGLIQDRIVTQLKKQGHKVQPRWDRTWFLNKLRNLKITRSSIFEDTQRLKNRTIIGKFYFFQYDPKTKDTLPYYDRFPLTIPIEMYNDGFLGLNFHYVAPQVRVNLLSTLMQYATNTTLDERTRLKLSYPLIKQSASLFKATPCIKRYLWSHVRSRFLELDASDWNSAMQLPFQQFKKADDKTIWKDSSSGGK